ncbi:MAG TPA: hypothetical protein VED46_02780 [Alphaproteobacteria bacterium]|nr:hypothetical protein [Alphaproteobacteria bacterium]
MLDLPYRTMPFARLADDETQLLASSEALVAGDLEAMACLIRTLPLSGSIARYGETIGRSCWSEFSQKRLDGDRPAQLRKRIGDSWGAVRERIAQATLSSRFLQDVLRRAGAPTAHWEPGWPEAFSMCALRHARDIRARYTFLDLAVDSGRLEPTGALL